ncbi:MAG TPA: hypothetical protein VFL99_03340 [Segeticoccus sp.]|uniref:hypothetical protein n=1 Tax=Segeticoccus sp. TaxID=2706531 RepID=UPI002D81165F|nr:hypothetical protein [Segeticoccus sp.]HET8599335.1 hypothetical protein [Segeticoccus sp.]
MDSQHSGPQAPDAEPGGVEDLGIGQPQDESPHEHHRELPIGRPDIRVAAGVVAALVVLVIAIVVVLLIV